MTRTFFSGRNNDRAPARQTTRTFFSGHNSDPVPARQTTRNFFSGRNNDPAPARQTTRTFFFPVVITIAFPKKMLSSVRKYVKPKPFARQNQKLTQQHNWKKSSSSPREASVPGETVGYPAQPGLIWRNRRLPSPTRINLEEP